MRYLLLLLLSGCATFEQPISFCEWVPPAQEKPLTAKWQVVRADQLSAMCGPKAEACYWPAWDVIIASTRFGDTSKLIRDHEIKHSKGGDHVKDCR